MSLFPKGWQNSAIVRWFGAIVGVSTIIYLGATGEKIGSTFTTILIYLAMGLVSIGVFLLIVFVIMRLVGEGRILSSDKVTPLGWGVGVFALFGAAFFLWLAIDAITFTSAG